MELASWVAWAILVVEAGALGFIGFWFSRATLRLFSTVTAFLLVIAVTRFGFSHPEYDPANLVDSFLSGVDEVTVALLHPLWPGHQVPAPGVAGRWIIAAALLLGYRQLEAWTLRWQAPELDLSATGHDRLVPGPAAPPASADGHSQDNAAATGDRTPAQFHAHLAAELRFRLPTMEVRSPAILPGGTRANALASIAESSGVSGAGMLSAAFRLAGLFWPSPQQIRVRTWVEPGPPVAGRQRADDPWDTAGSRITVLLEDVKTGLPVATKTVTGNTFNEAASMVAGYIARQVFAMDRSVPAYCYGMADGRDLGAMQLARLQRVSATCPGAMADARDAQISILGSSTGAARTAGIVRYELAQLLDMRGRHLESLRLHALNRELAPRFYRGRYRLATSLEMIANPQHYLPNEQATRDTFGETLAILARCGLTTNALDMSTDLEEVAVTDSSGQVRPGLRLSRKLAGELLEIAAKDLRDVRRQLTMWRVVRDALFRRDERAVWLPHWRHRHRQAFRDGVCVAELVIAVRRKLLERNGAAPGRLKRARDHWHLRKATWITSFIVSDTTFVMHGAKFIVSGTDLISALLENPGGHWWSAAASTAAPSARPRVQDRPRWLPWQGRTASWRAAYNTACLYAALADAALMDAEQTEEALADVERAEVAVAVAAQAHAARVKAALAHLVRAEPPETQAALTEAERADETVAEAALTEAARAEAARRQAKLVDNAVLRDLEDRVIVSLRRVVDNPESELERPSDWIDSDPDFSTMYQNPARFPAFQQFLRDQKRQDYPAAFLAGECPVPHTADDSAPVDLVRRLASASSRILSPVPGRAAIRQ